MIECSFKLLHECKWTNFKWDHRIIFFYKAVFKYTWTHVEIWTPWALKLRDHQNPTIWTWFRNEIWMDPHIEKCAPWTLKIPNNWSLELHLRFAIGFKLVPWRECGLWASTACNSGGQWRALCRIMSSRPLERNKNHDLGHFLKILYFLGSFLYFSSVFLYFLR